MRECSFEKGNEESEYEYNPIVESHRHSPSQAYSLKETENKENVNTSKQNPILLPWKNKVDIRHTLLSAKR